jgi:hypothetical protein
MWKASKLDLRRHFSEKFLNSAQTAQNGQKQTRRFASLSFIINPSKRIKDNVGE